MQMYLKSQQAGRPNLDIWQLLGPVFSLVFFFNWMPSGLLSCISQVESGLWVESRHVMKWMHSVR